MNLSIALKAWAEKAEKLAIRAFTERDLGNPRVAHQAVVDLRSIVLKMNGHLTRTTDHTKKVGGTIVGPEEVACIFRVAVAWRDACHGDPAATTKMRLEAQDWLNKIAAVMQQEIKPEGEAPAELAPPKVE